MGSSMTIENGGFDAGEMFDEAVEAAGLDPREFDENSEAGNEANVATVQDDSITEAKEPEAGKSVATAEDVAAAIESTKETEQEVDSIISQLIPKPEAAQHKTGFEPGKYVPVDEHIKLRARAQGAESKVQELEQRLETLTTQTGGVKPGEEAEKSPRELYIEENPELDDEPFPAKVEMAQRKFDDAKAQKAQQAKERAELIEREKQDKQNSNSAAIKAISTKAEQSEVEVRKANPDYDAVVLPIVKAKLITNEERIEFLKDANPAQKLYDICKAKAEALRGVLGVAATTTPAKKTATIKAPADNPADADDDDSMTDEEIFNAVADENFKAGR